MIRFLLISILLVPLSLGVNLSEKEKESTREKVIKTFVSEIGVREETGHNDGPQVKAYLNATGLNEGPPWCAAFITWVYVENGVETPEKHPAYSPTWFPRTRISKILQPGDVFGIYFRSKKRIAHVGFIYESDPDKDYIITVEGNTNPGGSRDGDGVYKRRRLKRMVYKSANWIDNAH